MKLKFISLTLASLLLTLLFSLPGNSTFLFGTVNSTFLLNNFNSDGSVSFIENVGQYPEGILFYAYTEEYSIWFKNEGIQVFFHSEDLDSLFIDYIHPNPKRSVISSGEMITNISYFRGPSSENWYSNVPVRSKLMYQELYPGIDLIFFGQNGELKAEWHTNPDHDLDEIKTNISRHIDPSVHNLRSATYLLIEKISNPSDNDLEGITKSQPGNRQDLNTIQNYKNLTDATPSLIFGTLLGGSNNENEYGLGDIAIDDTGALYIAGYTSSNDFPTSIGAFDTEFAGGGSYNSDAFVIKFSPDGKNLEYATFLGGPEGYEIIKSMAIDSNGQVLVTGRTESASYPTTDNALDDEFSGGSDAFVTKLSADGTSLIFSTFVGGNSYEAGEGITVDETGIYVTGFTYSDDFETTTGAYRESCQAYYTPFVVKLSNDGSNVNYSTCLGATDYSTSRDIAVDAQGNAYIVGRTNGIEVTPFAFDQSYNGNEDGFLLKLNETGADLVYSTYIGGNEFDEPYHIAVDESGSAYIVGTTSSPDFPTTSGTIDPMFTSSITGFLLSINPDGSQLNFSTFFGGTEYGCFGELNDLTLDQNNNIYLTGGTSCPDFPLTENAIRKTMDGNESFIAILNNSASELLYSSFVAGDRPGYRSNHVEVDDLYNVYVIGNTSGSALPLTPDAFDISPNGGIDIFAVKFRPTDLLCNLVNDTDGDGLLDGWEFCGYDQGDDGTIDVNLPVLGANPYHKDIFIEIDYMKAGPGEVQSHRPHPLAIKMIVDSFAAAPVNNPDGEPGIYLHVDYGSDAPLTWGQADTWGDLSESDEIMHFETIGSCDDNGSNFGWDSFNVFKNAYFSEERAAAFHYNLWGHSLCPSNLSVSGISAGAPASDFIVTLGGWKNNTGTINNQAGTFMHELGHNLGLLHGGDENENYKPNYLSVMNYAYQKDGLIINGFESNFDYSYSALPTLNEFALNERDGINLPPLVNGDIYGARYFCDPGLMEAPVPSIDFDGTTVDWNCDNDSDDLFVIGDINNGQSTILTGFDDWSNLIFDGGEVGGLGVGETLPEITVVDELTFEEAQMIPTLYGLFLPTIVR